MLRRTHKKSRRGCLECKRRHIKCDERRPICIHCVTAERDCVFPGDADGASPDILTSSPTLATTGMGTGAGSADIPAQASNGGAGPSITAITHPDTPADDQLHVDMVHLELLHHYLTDHFLAMSMPSAEITLRLTMKYALRTPFLMYQALAISARHLSVIRPEQQTFYHHLAIQLQTKALGLFNALDITSAATVEERVPVFMFSSVLGLHALCDALSFRDKDFPTALSRFTGYLYLHRGTYTIIEANWEGFKESELKPVIEFGTSWFLMEGDGHEMSELRARVLASDMDKESIFACQKAIGHLQTVLDGKPHYTVRAHLIVSWPVMIQHEFVKLLEEGRPEALAVLAWYFAAIHLVGQSIWLFGDAGQHLFKLAKDYLGPEWASLLEKPAQIMKEFDRQQAQEEREYMAHRQEGASS